MIYIGIDPGKSGALAILHENGDLSVEAFDAVKYIQALQSVRDKPAVACVEKVSAMPGQGVVSMFNFGHNLGWIEGVLQAYFIPYQLIRPQLWKKEFGLSGDKNKSIEVCQKLFPNVNLLRTERCKKPHDGIAEAVLMAEFARREF